MNRYVYLVHAGYQDLCTSASDRSVGQMPAESVAQRVAQWSAELGRYLPDALAQVSGARIRRDPDVIRVTVVTSLDEVVTDRAFVQFIQARKAAHRLEQVVAG
jgi:hypothetical protein